jgi:hypothetical protein
VGWSRSSAQGGFCDLCVLTAAIRVSQSRHDQRTLQDHQVLKHALRHWSPRQGTQQRPLLTHFHRVVRASSTLPVWPAINAVSSGRLLAGVATASVVGTMTPITATANVEINRAVGGAGTGAVAHWCCSRHLSFVSLSRGVISRLNTHHCESASASRDDDPTFTSHARPPECLGAKCDIAGGRLEAVVIEGVGRTSARETRSFVMAASIRDYP